MPREVSNDILTKLCEAPESTRKEIELPQIVPLTLTNSLLLSALTLHHCSGISFLEDVAAAQSPWQAVAVVGDLSHIARFC